MAELADAKDLGSFAQQVYRFESCYPHQARGFCTAPRFKWIKDPFKAPGYVAHMSKLKQNAETPLRIIVGGAAAPPNPPGAFALMQKPISLLLLLQLRKEYGQTILLVTHDKELAGIADRTIEIVDGKIK